MPVPTEFVDCPPGGRQVVGTRRVRLGDVEPSGRLRVDALAAYLQDVAADDVDEVGIPGAWVLRRTVIRIDHLPKFRDDVRLVTFCSGTGGRWAERRTTVFVGDRVAVETVGLWVSIDASGRPAPLEQWFFAHYEIAANGRKVSGRLQHRPPPDDVDRRPWPMRSADFDVLDHANNAAAWQAFEDELARRTPRRRIRTAEIEYRDAIDPGDEIELVSTLDGNALACWLMRGDEVRVSSVIELA